MTVLYRKETIIPVFMLLIVLLMTFEPKGHYYIALALSSLLLSYAGFLKRKTIFDTIAIIVGLVLFLVFCTLLLI